MYTYSCRCCNKSYTRKHAASFEKQFCGAKCKYSIEGLKLIHPEDEAIRLREEYLNSKIRTLPAYIKRYGETLGTEKYNEYIERHKKSLSKEGYIEKYGEELGKQKWFEYCNSVTVSEASYIEKYGEELGKQKWFEYCTSHSRDVKTYKHKLIVSEASYIEKYGEELGKEKWQQTSLKKKKALSRLFYNRNTNNIEYELYVMVFENIGLIKIGISKDTATRFKYFENLFNSGYYFILDKGSYDKIRKLEQQYHIKYDTQNILLEDTINGFTEFFDISILQNINN